MAYKVLITTVYGDTVQVQLVEFSTREEAAYAVQEINTQEVLRATSLWQRALSLSDLTKSLPAAPAKTIMQHAAVY